MGRVLQEALQSCQLIWRQQAQPGDIAHLVHLSDLRLYPLWCLEETMEERVANFHKIGSGFGNLGLQAPSLS